MRRHEEELDETIGRVAAAITFVPADPSLAGRVAERISRAPDAFAWRPLFAGAVGVAALVMVIALMTNDRRQPIESPHVVNPSTAEDAPMAEARPPVVPEPPRVATVAPQRASRPATTRIAEPAVSVYEIAALPAPAPLDLPDLQTAALTIAPGDIAPLDLINLAIADLEDQNDPKE